MAKFRVHADREVAEDVLADIRLDLAESVKPGRGRVEIGYEDERVVGVLETHPVLQRSDEVSEVERARRPITGEQPGATTAMRLVSQWRIRTVAHRCPQRSSIHVSLYHETDANDRSIADAGSHVIERL